MVWYSVSIDTRGDNPSDVTEEAIDAFVDSLRPHSRVAIGGADPPRWGATISVEADSAVLAVTKAAAIIRRLGADAWLPDRPVVKVEAVREDVLDEEPARPLT
jgi:hypothetical protein